MSCATEGRRSRSARAASRKTFLVEYWPELYKCVTARGCDFSRSNSTDSGDADALLCANVNATNATTGLEEAVQLCETDCCAAHRPAVNFTQTAASALCDGFAAEKRAALLALLCPLNASNVSNATAR